MDTASDRVIAGLIAHDKNDPAFAERLAASLRAARKQARKKPTNGGLQKDLYDLLAWPVTLGGYYAFLRAFSRWVPDQSGAEGWEVPGTSQYQEVYDRLCHFYYLIDQPGPDSTLIQTDPWFADWLVRYADAWGSFLDTPGSFTEADLQSYIHYSPQYRVEDSMVGEPPNWVPNAPSGWNTFNQFFARELNPGLRPIASPMENALVTSPADCTFHQTFPIDADSNVQEHTIKGTHTIGNVNDLLQDSEFAGAFANGTYAHYFLAPYSYHRFHSPVTGTIRECRAVPGQVFLDVNVENGQFDAPDNADDGYEFRQARGVLVVDTAGSPYGDVGLIGVVPIGMAQVSSVHMTAVVGSEPLKGDEFGFFLFGGSDIILLFQEGAVESLNTSTDYRHYGQESALLKLRS